MFTLLEGYFAKLGSYPVDEQLFYGFYIRKKVEEVLGLHACIR